MVKFGHKNGVLEGLVKQLLDLMNQEAYNFDR